MIYNFDQIINRRNTNSIKWKVNSHELPLTIADMDFSTAPEIIQALNDKIATGVFGYEDVPSSYFAAVKAWYLKQHQVNLPSEWQLFVTGVIPALSSIVRRLTHPGEQILVLSPVYDIFYHSIENNGRITRECPLIYDRQKRKYQINFEDLTAKLAEPQTTMMILCNPHNPIGQVWSQEILTQILQLCKKYQVILVSDEIHGDLVLEKPDYTPILSLDSDLNNQTIALVSTSKTFNLAALHAATAIIPNSYLRYEVNRGFNNDEIAEPNFAAVTATIAAYEKGAPWLDSLKSYLTQNKQLVRQVLDEKISKVKLVPGNATYLLWLDCTDIPESSTKIVTKIAHHTGLILADGAIYRGNGSHFLRMSIACPRAELQDALSRLVAASKFL